MPKQKVAFNVLQNYLPPNTFTDVMEYITQHKIHLTISKDRQTILGNYKNAHQGQNHRISVNGGLNKYAFLITFLHEVAHLLTYNQYQHFVAPHGKEWKANFSQILEKFWAKNIFPPDIATALLQTINNPAASSCADAQLMLALKNYDAPTGLTLVANVPLNTPFAIKDGRVFTKGPKQRTRHKCTEVATGKQYLFSGLYEVKVLQPNIGA
jgi:SprT protein